ncbi:transcriptional regulator, Crp/Fnr family [hydrothermal vent metagenome]|uniref:Transcriptional regulator, Crp/Fnr family n=1 Tax=hydrothermal vent metagenome TaxID=652676 RepID=A0A3B0WNR9_9ZZZZ
MKAVTDISEQLQLQCPELAVLLNSDACDIFKSAKRSRTPAGKRLFRESDRCKSFMWLLSGSVRVFINSPGGREITLYRIDPGELCVLSLQSMLSGDVIPAEAVAESDIVSLTLSQSDFDKAIDASSLFRRYLLKFLSQRIGDIVQLVSEVAFQRLEFRLSCILGQLFERSNGRPLSITHAQLARELGTTREVISRILKELEYQDCIELSRGEISLVSRESLEWFSR